MKQKRRNICCSSLLFHFKKKISFWVQFITRRGDTKYEVNEVTFPVFSSLFVYYVYFIMYISILLTLSSFTLIEKLVIQQMIPVLKQDEDGLIHTTYKYLIFCYRDAL